MPSWRNGFAALGAGAVGEMNAESRAARAGARTWAVQRRAARAQRLASERGDRPARRQAERCGPAAPTIPTATNGRCSPMPTDPFYPGERIGPEPPEGQFRADLVRYLDALPVSELGSLLSELPRTRPGVLMIELNQRLPDSDKLLPPAGTPGPGEGRRRSLREWAADRRAARNHLQAGPPDVVDRYRWQ